MFHSDWTFSPPKSGIPITPIKSIESLILPPILKKSDTLKDSKHSKYQANTGARKLKNVPQKRFSILSKKY